MGDSHNIIGTMSCQRFYCETLGYLGDDQSFCGPYFSFRLPVRIARWSRLRIPRVCWTQSDGCHQTASLL